MENAYDKLQKLQTIQTYLINIAHIIRNNSYHTSNSSLKHLSFILFIFIHSFICFIPSFFDKKNQKKNLKQKKKITKKQKENLL